MAVCLAVDIGAESGRVVRGEICDGKLEVAEVHRFANVPHRDNGLRWDISRLLKGIRDGLTPADSLGIDTWGVDYGLLDKHGTLLADPYHYRDPRTEGKMEEMCQQLGKEFIFRHTGTQFLPFNTLFQLTTDDLKDAHQFLTIADLLHHQLVGSAACEFSMAMTTQCFDPQTRDWAWPLIEAAGLPSRVFPDVMAAGTSLGTLDGVKLVAPATHDTASAVASCSSGSFWISSGTWSILGVNHHVPLVTNGVLEANFTNEGAADGTFRLCKNVMGMWLLQQCREAWGLDYETMQAMGATPLASPAYFDPDHRSLLSPGDMPTRIAALVGRSMEPPETVRAILECLAFKYRFLLERLQELTGERYGQINIVGGGSRNTVLNQLVADVCEVPVLAGPVEATAIGNLLCQMISLGAIEDWTQAQALVRTSFERQTFRPQVDRRRSYQDFKEQICKN